MTYDLRLGRYQDVLADVEVDAVICDPPFGERTHAAWDTPQKRRSAGNGRGVPTVRKAIDYGHWTPTDVRAFVDFWSPRTRGWIVALTSHDLAQAWTEASEQSGRYIFAPLPCVTWGGSIRLSGDGPSSWTVWAMVSRPRTREMQKWGTLCGAYSIDKSGGSEQNTLGRGKPLTFMRALVHDYSRPGDLVCDPTAGYGSTLAAALQRGRRAIGAEVDPEVYAEARKRLDQVQVVDLFVSGRATQGGLGL